MKPTKLLENATTWKMNTFIVYNRVCIHKHMCVYIQKYGTYERNDVVVRLSGGRTRRSCTAKHEAMCLHNKIYYINK